MQASSAKRRQEWKVKKKGHVLNVTSFKNQIDSFINSLPLHLPFHKKAQLTIFFWTSQAQTQ